MSDVFLNILKDTKDPHYRYKMPKLTAKIEGSGNGIKTVITNMTAIAKALDRPPSYPTKYFGCELGAQVTIANDLFVVNGSHDPEKLLSLLYSFIKKFVLCQKCSNPETALTIVKGNINQKCIACGYETTIPKAIHKLTTFIINHPPEGGSAAAAVSKTSGKSGSSGKDKEKKASKKDKANNSGTTSEKNGGGQKDAFDINQGEDEDGFDEEEFSSSAYAERMRELTEGLGGSTGIYMSDAKEHANILYKMLNEKKDAQLLADPATQKELVREAEKLDIKDKATLILSEVLFTENMVAEIKQHRLLLLRFCHENKKAQKYLLGGYEKIVGDVFKDKLFSQAMVVLKTFYDEDILEEEVIVEWAAKESKKYVSKEMSRKIHEKVAPFIKWLKEAEEDSDEEGEDEEGNSGSDSNKSSDNVQEKNGKVNVNGNGNKVARSEEDEDDEEEVEFSHRVQGLRIEEVKPVVAVKPVNAEVIDTNNNVDGEEDIDIDNI